MTLRMPVLPSGFVDRGDGTAGQASERLIPRFAPDYVPPAAPRPEPRPSKFSNVRMLGPAPWGGEIEYASAGEAKLARELEARKRAGLSRGWGCQISIPIGKGPRGYRRHKVDFYETEPDGRLRLIEQKGHDHADGKQRRADLEAMGTPVEVRRG